MSEPKGPALLVAVTHAVKEAVKARPIIPANGGSPQWWPLVARVMTNLTGQVGDRNDWRKRYRRRVEGLSLEAVGAMAASVDPGVYRDAVKAVVEGGEALEIAVAVVNAGESAEVLDPLVLPDGWEDLLYENAKEQARLRQATHKLQNVFNIRVTTTMPVMHVWTADWHILDSGTDHDQFDEDVRIWTTTPGIRLGIGGDLANWFSPAVLPRAMPANTLPSDLTKPILRRKLMALREQIDYVVNGNHDEFPAAAGWHPLDEICREFAFPNLGPGGRVYYHVGQVRYQIEARHSFNFNSVLNDTNSHRQLWTQAGKPDMVFTAHLHHPTLHHRTFDGDDTVWARNGSYKREDHYARSKNFVHTTSEPPDQPGVILLPDRKHMIPFRSYRDGLPLLAVLRAQYQHKAG